MLRVLRSGYAAAAGRMNEHSVTAPQVTYDDYQLPGSKVIHRRGGPILGGHFSRSYKKRASREHKPDLNIRQKCVTAKTSWPIHLDPRLLARLHELRA